MIKKYKKEIISVEDFNKALKGFEKNIAFQTYDGIIMYRKIESNFKSAWKPLKVKTRSDILIAIDTQIKRFINTQGIYLDISKSDIKTIEQQRIIIRRTLRNRAINVYQYSIIDINDINRKLPNGIKFKNGLLTKDKFLNNEYIMNTYSPYELSFNYKNYEWDNDRQWTKDDIARVEYFISLFAKTEIERERFLIINSYRLANHSLGIFTCFIGVASSAKSTWNTWNNSLLKDKQIVSLNASIFNKVNFGFSLRGLPGKTTCIIDDMSSTIIKNIEPFFKSIMNNSYTIQNLEFEKKNSNETETRNSQSWFANFNDVPSFELNKNEIKKRVKLFECKVDINNKHYSKKYHNGGLKDDISKGEKKYLTYLYVNHYLKSFNAKYYKENAIAYHSIYDKKMMEQNLGYDDVYVFICGMNAGINDLVSIRLYNDYLDWLSDNKWNVNKIINRMQFVNKVKTFKEVTYKKRSKANKGGKRPMVFMWVGNE